MPRQLRLHVPHGFYHVTLRGNHRQAIFREASDRDILDCIVAEALERFHSRLHAYCWMSNHLHVLVQVATDPLGRLMQRIASQYARAFQSRLNTTGHLFERRYHCLLVDADDYLLELVRYIHLNPVRAGMVRDPADYPWSSHQVYLGRKQVPWVTTAFALGLLHAEQNRAREAYAEFVRAALLDPKTVTIPAGNEQEPRVLGNDEFLSRVPVPASRVRLRCSLDKLVQHCCAHFAVSAEQLRAPGRCRRLARIRAIIADLAITHHISSLQAVAHHFGRDESSLRTGVARLRSTGDGPLAVTDLFPEQARYPAPAP